MAEVGAVYVTVMPSTKGFSKALTNASKSAGLSSGTSAGNSFGSSFGSCVKSSFGKIVSGVALGNLAANALSKVTVAISSSMDAAVSRVDTIANFPKVMQNLGYGASEAEAAINRLSSGIDGMPTSLDGIVSMTQQLAPLCGGLDEATTLSLAMNNMFLASRASTADQTRAMQQYTQMLARGKVELNDWRTLQEVMPGQLNQVAVALLGAGKNSTDLYDALKEGVVTMDDFNDAVVRLNSEGVEGFASFEEQARASTQGIGTAVENVKNRVAKAIGKVLDHIGQANIAGVINGWSSSFTLFADQAIKVWDGLMSGIDVGYFTMAFDDLSAALGDVFASGDAAAGFGNLLGGVLTNVADIVIILTPLIASMAQAFSDLLAPAGAISKAVNGISAAFVEFFSSVIDGIDFEGFKEAILGIGEAFGSVFAPEWDAASFGEAVANALNSLIPVIQMLNPVVSAFAMALTWAINNLNIIVPIIGIVVAAVVGLNVFQTVSGWIGVFTGGLAKATPAISASVPQMIAMAAAGLALGAAILAVCAGVALLVNAAIQLSAAGPMAAVALGGLVTVVLLFVGGMAALGPALDAGAIGMAALGVAALGVGEGINLACQGIATLSGALPTIAEHGGGAALALGELGAAMMLAAPSTAALDAALLGLAAALVAAAVPLGAFGWEMGGFAPSAKEAGEGTQLISTSLPRISAMSEAASRGIARMSDACSGATPMMSKLKDALATLLDSGSAASSMMASLSSVLRASAMQAAMLGSALGVIALTMSAISMSGDAVATSVMVMAAALSGSAPAVTAFSTSANAAAPAFISMASALSGCAAPALVLAGSLATVSVATDRLTYLLGRLTGTMAINGSAALRLSSSFDVAYSRMRNGAQSLQATIRNLSQEVMSAVRAMQNAFNGMRLHIPSPTLGALPHFSMSGAFNYKTGAVPRINVNWYAKGGVFEHPSIIGVGEAGREVVAPERMLKRYMDEAVRRSSDPGVSIHDCTFVVRKESDIDAVAEKLSQKIGREVRSKL